MSAIRVQCPNPECQASFSVAPDDAMRFRRCPRCGAELTGPDGPGPVDPSATSGAWVQTPAAGLTEGATFAGRYTIVRLLGRGGMGAVYLARDERLDRPVALKVPLVYGAASEFVRRFQREARAAARLQHPNICPIHDVGDHGGQPYLTMAYIDGISLADYLRKRGAPLEPERAVRLVRRMALALQEAHEAGIVHRDLKPANVMVTREGRPIVMDFGVARLDDPADSLRTRSGVMMGSPAYMPLEQHRGDTRAIGPRSDVYSLGVVLFQMLTGRLPFQGPLANILEQMLTASKPPPPSSLRAGLDPALDAICQKAMARDVEDRHGSMRDLALALDGYLATAATAPTSARTDDTEREPISTPREVSAAPRSTRPQPQPQPRPQPQPQRIDPPGRRWKSTWYWLVPAAIVSIALLGVVVRVVTDKGTVTITGTDPNMEVRIDGDVVVIERPGDSITLQAGRHELLVMRGDLRVTTRSFEVRRGQETPLRVEYAPRERPQTAEALKPPAETAPPSRPPAVAADVPKPPAAIVTQSAPMVPPVWTNTIGMTFVRLEPDEFQMGSSKEQIELLKKQFPAIDIEYLTDEQPQRPVRITKGFSLGRCEVTQGQYQAVMGRNPSVFKGSDDLPVELVSWLDAVAFCNRLSEKEGRPSYYRIAGDDVTIVGGVGYRLPTEAEWEYACRAGTRGLYGGSDDPESLVKIGNVDGKADGYENTAPVGKFQANAWGLYDMIGNVWEWCEDYYKEDYYENAPTEDPRNAAVAPSRVIRGGSWFREPGNCRPAGRVRFTPGFRSADLGFRVAAVQ